MSDGKGTYRFGPELIFKISLLILGFLGGAALLTFYGYTHTR